MKNLRTYGNKPYIVAVIHGGPGTPGNLAPVAQELSCNWGILEPFQTYDSIEGQIKELANILENNGTPPLILIGHSWGAWLVIIFSARYPTLVKKLILIGSGPFEEKYASGLMETRLNRLNENEKLKLKSLTRILNDPNVQEKDMIMAEFGRLMSKADSYCLLAGKNETFACQFDIYRSVWKEASDLRKTGKLLEYSKKIICPVVAIHGDHDSHAGEGIKGPLSKTIKDFRFLQLEKCGHEPWQEKYAKDMFYKILKDELESNTTN